MGIKYKSLMYVAILFLVALVAGDIHYYSAAGVKKCFDYELTPGSLLIGKFHMEIFDDLSNTYIVPNDAINTGVLIDVEEALQSKHRVVHQRASSRGQFTFTALEKGRHVVCFTPKSFYRKKWIGSQSENTDPEFSKVRFTIDFEVRDAAGAEIKGYKHGLLLQVLKLNDKLVDIRRVQDMILEKERSFRNQSENICSAVVYWSFILLGASLIVTCYQLISLNYLQHKRKLE